MSPSTNDLRNAFDNAYKAYLAAMNERKRALEDALDSSNSKLYEYYALQTQTENQRRQEYLDIANKLQSALLQNRR